MNNDFRRSPWFGWVSLLIGITLSILVVMEFRDGELLGGRSNGITIQDNPIVFFVCIALQVFIILVSLLSAYSILKRK